jgi:hypothetical protein
MTSIRKALALGALALVAGLVGAQPAWAQLGRKAVAAPVPADSSSSIVSLLSLSDTNTTIQPTALGFALGRPPVSQPIPGPVINN